MGASERAKERMGASERASERGSEGAKGRYGDEEVMGHLFL